MAYSPWCRMHICILFGGASFEHEVSISSARSIVSHMDRHAHSITMGGLDRRQRLQFFEVEEFLCRFPPYSSFDDASESCSFDELRRFDLIFPALHGQGCEDGTIQGLLSSLQVPYIGEGVLVSAICMDKGVTKRLLREARIPIADFHLTSERYEGDSKEWKERFGLPFFIKPSRSGSSLGVSCIHSLKEVDAAWREARRFSKEVIIERAICGMELECAVLGGETLFASPLGRVISKPPFYTYENKYLHPDGALFEVPFLGKKEFIHQAQQMAKRAFLALGCQRMARVDFFVDQEGQLYVSELNTLPGFTPISLFPRLLAEGGIPYEKLLSVLIDQALS